MTTHIAEYQVQVLVEMEDGGEVPHRTREYVESKIPFLFPPGTRDIRHVIVIANEAGEVLSVNYENNPTPEMRKRAWK